MVAALASERCHNNMAKLKDNKDFRGIKELPSHATTHGSKTCLFRLGTIALPDAGRGGCLNGLAGKMGRWADFNSVSPGCPHSRRSSGCPASSRSSTRDSRQISPAVERVCVWHMISGGFCEDSLESTEPEVIETQYDEGSQVQNQHTWGFDPRRNRFFDGKPLKRLWLLHDCQDRRDGDDPEGHRPLVSRRMMKTKKLKMMMRVSRTRRTPSTSSD
jgi:hypothetical protein